MSLTSYRAAPPRVRGLVGCFRDGFFVRPVAWVWFCWFWFWFWFWFCLASLIGRPGSDLLSRVLRRSTIGAEGFHGRVRDGIGCSPLAIATRSSDQRSGLACQGQVFHVRE